MVQAVADLGLALPLVIPPQSPAVLVERKVNGAWASRDTLETLTRYRTDH